MAKKHGVAIVYDESEDVPAIDEATAGFSYARFMTSRPDEEAGVSAGELDAIAKRAKAWTKRGEVFVYFISGAKERNPAAAKALIAKFG